MLYRTVSMLAVFAIVCGFGCVFRTPREPTLPKDHDVTAEHTMGDLVYESGFTGRGDNSIVGLVELGYDDNFGAADLPFRMALMIDPDDGPKIDDFFRDIPYQPGNRKIVGMGNARLRVPTVHAVHADNYRSVPLLAEHFPDHIDADFDLTFKEFTGHAYCLENVPKGTALIWFQTGFDGNRITQFPLVVRLEPAAKRLVRLDLRIGKTPEELPFWIL